MKKVIAFIYCIAGGSLLLFTLSLLGCSKNDFYFMYSGMKSEIIRYDTFANEPIPANDTCSFSAHRIRLLLQSRVLSTVSLQGVGNRLFTREQTVKRWLRMLGRDLYQ